MRFVVIGILFAFLAGAIYVGHYGWVSAGDVTMPDLGTWWLGLPASSSHTLIGSIIGVGVANALMQGRDGNGC